MSQDLDLPQLHPDGYGHGHDDSADADTRPGSDLRRLAAVPVELSVEVGRARMTVGETLELREGSVITLDRMAGEPVDVLVNGTTIARGEVVVVDEQFGLRLTRVLDTATAATAGSLTEDGTAEGEPSDAGAER